MPLATAMGAGRASTAPAAAPDADPFHDLARELDAIRDAVRADLGAADRAYIKRLITAQRRL